MPIPIIPSNLLLIWRTKAYLLCLLPYFRFIELTLEMSTGLVYTESREEALANLEILMEDHEWGTMQIAGTLEELSPNPVLLEQLIKTSKCLTYDQSQPSVKVKKAKAKDLAALNELLHQPLFELRELDYQTIMEIEKEFREDFEY